MQPVRYGHTEHHTNEQYLQSDDESDDDFDTAPQPPKKPEMAQIKP